MKKVEFHFDFGSPNAYLTSEYAARHFQLRNRLPAQLGDRPLQFALRLLHAAEWNSFPA